MNWSVLAFVFVGVYAATVLAGAINNVAAQLMSLSFNVKHDRIKLEVKQYA